MDPASYYRRMNDAYGQASRPQKLARPNGDSGHPSSVNDKRGRDLYHPQAIRPHDQTRLSGIQSMKTIRTTETTKRTLTDVKREEPAISKPSVASLLRKPTDLSSPVIRKPLTDIKGKVQIRGLGPVDLPKPAPVVQQSLKQSPPVKAIDEDEWDFILNATRPMPAKKVPTQAPKEQSVEPNLNPPRNLLAHRGIEAVEGSSKIQVPKEHSVEPSLKPPRTLLAHRGIEAVEGSSKSQVPKEHSIEPNLKPPRTLSAHRGFEAVEGASKSQVSKEHSVEPNLKPPRTLLAQRGIEAVEGASNRLKSRLASPRIDRTAACKTGGRYGLSTEIRYSRPPQSRASAPRTFERSRKSDGRVRSRRSEAGETVELKGLAPLHHIVPDVSLKYWRIRKIRFESVKNYQRARLSVDGVKLGSDGEPIFSAEGFPLQWHSSAIGKRIGTHVLETSSGKVYRLVGPMEVDLARKEGFSREFCEKFRHGFPHNWKFLCRNEFSGPTPSPSLDSQADEIPAAQVEARKDPVVRAKKHPRLSLTPEAAQAPFEDPWNEVRDLAAEAASDEMHVELDSPTTVEVVITEEPAEPGSVRVQSKQRLSPVPSEEIKSTSSTKFVKDNHDFPIRSTSRPPSKNPHDLSMRSASQAPSNSISTTSRAQIEAVRQTPSLKPTSREVIQASEDDEEDERPVENTAAPAPLKADHGMSVDHKRHDTSEDSPRSSTRQSAPSEKVLRTRVEETRSNHLPTVTSPIRNGETVTGTSSKPRDRRKGSKPQHVLTPPHSIPQKRSHEDIDQEPRRARHLKALLSGPFGTPKDLSGQPRMSASRDRDRRGSRPAGIWWAVDSDVDTDGASRDKRSQSVGGSRRWTMPPEGTPSSKSNNKWPLRKGDEGMGTQRSTNSIRDHYATKDESVPRPMRPPASSRRPSMTSGAQKPPTRSSAQLLLARHAGSPHRSYSQPPATMAGKRGHEPKIDYDFSDL